MKVKFDTLNPNKRIHGLDTPIIGLTGGIATGKSTVSQMLREEGVAVIDADALVKDVYRYPEAKKFIKEVCPEAIKQDEIHFPTLREKFFTNSELKAAIENFIYQHLPQAFMEAFGKFKKPQFVVYDVPLLFEKGIDNKVDLTVLVYAPRKLQHARLLERDGKLESMADEILNQQMDIEDKKYKAQFIIDNSSTMTELKEEVRSFLRKIKT